MNKKYKILTMCAGGNVRSVGLKWLLRYKYGHDALACGQDANPPETRDMLCEWADYVVVMTENYFKEINPKYHYKTLICEVGEDRYGYASHPELFQIADDWIINGGIFNK